MRILSSVRCTGLSHWLALLMLCLPLPAWSWGREGHVIVADIAEQHLTPTALAAVQQLLRNDHRANGQFSGAHHLADVASWADDLRSTEKGKALSHWHYRDNPVCSRQLGPCQGGDCVDVRIGEMIATLQSQTASAREQNEALKWLVHLVGDIHQPLHAGENHDRGGNAITVTLAEGSRRRHENLHSIWDKDLVLAAVEQGSIADHLPATFLQGTPQQWMSESRDAAQQVAYGKLPGFRCGGDSPDDVVIDEAYRQAGIETVRSRLQLAGLRLAGVLNTIYR